MPLDRIPSMATTKDARYRAKQDVAEQNEDQTLVEILTKRDQLETVQCTYYQTEEMSNTSADSDSSSSSGQALGLVETGSSTCTDQPRETVMQTAQRNNNAQEELLIQALENEQQYEDTPSDEGCPPVPTEVSHGLRQPSGDTDVETCVSSVTDGLQDADLFVDHMYPTLNTVVEEEESHSNLALKSLNDNSNRSRASSTTTTGETQQQQASQNQQHYEMSLNKTESKEELQRNEAAVPKAAKMDKRDQASPAAIIVGIGSRTTSALLVDKSDNQQDDQKDLQGKPEALRPKENASGTINPQEPAPDPQQPVSTPGAHSIDGPGSNSAIDTTDGRILQVPPSTTAPMDNTEIIDRQLVRANPVQEDLEAPPDLMQAYPVNLDEQERQQQKRKKQTQTFIFILLLVILAGAAIVGTVAGTHKKKPDEPIRAATPTPTVYLSMEPSEVPSSAPTGALDMLLDSLPDYTLASMNNGSDTPQWKAWQWLTNHQNITFLPEWRKTQLFAMATFFFSFEGENWTPLVQERWMDETKDECDWFSSGFGMFVGGHFVPLENLGVPATASCNIHGRLTSLDLIQLELTGFSPSMPPEIMLLTSLSRIALRDNGDIDSPLNDFLIPQMAQLSQLKELILFRNGLTGTLPTELGLMTNLTDVSVLANAVTGTIPTELGRLTLLTSLHLASNSLEGTLPSELWLLTSLESLVAGHYPVGNAVGNYLTGQLPSEIGTMTSLRQLSFSRNLFTGEIPSEYGLLISLQSMFLFDNFLSGGLPSEVGMMTLLKYLMVQGNMLSGLFPNELQELAALQWLTLENNNLSGSLPSELGLLTGLLNLKLGGNSFSGSIHSELGQLMSLQELDLSDLTLLTGPIASELSSLPSLGWLNLSGSVGVTGTVPDELCFFQNSSCAYVWSTKPCFLAFDCTDQLCGCDCLCSNETSNRNS